MTSTPPTEQPDLDPANDGESNDTPPPSVEVLDADVDFDGGVQDQSPVVDPDDLDFPTDVEDGQ